MRLIFLISFAIAGGLSAPVDASGDEPSRDDLFTEALTARTVLELSKTRSLEVQIAGTQVLEARGRLSGAKAIGTDNPSIEGLSGSTEMSGESRELDVSIPFGFGLRRSPRIATAKADLEREERLALDVERQAAGQALAAYYRVLHAEQRLGIARDRKALAEELRRIAAERLRAGDVARLELVIAEVELSRAEGEVLSEERTVAQSRVELAHALGLPSGRTLEVVGELADRSVLEERLENGGPAERADVLAAESEVRAADAAISLSRRAVLPDLALRLNYEKTGDEDLLRPGLAMSIPVFDRGQGARVEARARQERASIQLAVQRSRASAEVEGARAARASMVASAREIEEHALPKAIEVEQLARQGYEAGKLDLTALLLVRGSALETRREHADRLLDAAMTSIDLAVSIGAIP